MIYIHYITSVDVQKKVSSSLIWVPKHMFPLVEFNIGLT